MYKYLTIFAPFETRQPESFAILVTKRLGQSRDTCRWNSAHSWAYYLRSVSDNRGNTCHGWKDLVFVLLKKIISAGWDAVHKKTLETIVDKFTHY